MAPRNRQRRVDLETNTAPDALPSDLRREDMPETPPDSMPPRDGEIPAGGGFTPAEDGGNAQHPVHDEDQEDADPSDFERALDRRDASTRSDR